MAQNSLEKFLIKSTKFLSGYPSLKLTKYILSILVGC